MASSSLLTLLSPRRIRFASLLFFLLVCLLDLLVCPYSKVEESFQLQATHDLYYFGGCPAVQRVVVVATAAAGGGGGGGGGLATTSTLEHHHHHQQQQQQQQLQLPYDHIQYPGVVPRTFTGPAILATLCRLLLWPLSFVPGLTINSKTVQFLARFLLLLANGWGWYRMSRAVDSRLLLSTTRASAAAEAAASGKSGPTSYTSSSSSTTTPPHVAFTATGSWLLVITACQFHMTFYASRMLPNVFALGVVLHSYASWIQGGKNNIQRAAALLVMATAIFRCDLLLLLVSIGLSWLLQRQMTILGALKVGIMSGMVALLAITIPLDSLLWQRWVWPEGQVFWFNTVLGKSKEWGTSSWHWYFSSAIPKAMLLTLLLVPFSTFRVAELAVATEKRHGRVPPLSFHTLVDTQWLPFLAPILGFVVLYSFLGHKEMRFIFPALPILNLIAAAGMTKLTTLAFPPVAKDKAASSPSSTTWTGRLGFVCGIFCIVLTLGGNMVFVAVSRWNYPGGVALTMLVDHLAQRQSTTTMTATSNDDNTAAATATAASVHVFIDNAAAMSGVSLFGQRAAKEATSRKVQWTFSKEGYEETNVIDKERGYQQFTHLLSENPDVVASSFHILYTIQGNPRLGLRERAIVTDDAMYVLERDGWSDEDSLSSQDQNQ